jgi:hypothetical protein
MRAACSRLLLITMLEEGAYLGKKAGPGAHDNKLERWQGGGECKKKYRIGTLTLQLLS